MYRRIPTKRLQSPGQTISELRKRHSHSYRVMSHFDILPRVMPKGAVEAIFPCRFEIYVESPHQQMPNGVLNVM
ncbi:hypothetical protein CC1G_15789 [Coprinopsis cinerea okayama7|uniref:Uncharacterized protein n=1 Tax=Coprinopsis cinerea (strain Okayama-7 / 130 / ATCC MYA-4618 / FGSC 9003) TaxID=240176 RepID=D6RQZ2_COPC7|nr:hypothetical protein CC1G_15789 [Coprinopsis cinerea okayama7\|eukprot:XP_002910069.1 hypothetical protein CC1G_15789 [Coprinopsis cinerea okayama7\